MCFVYCNKYYYFLCHFKIVSVAITRSVLIIIEVSKKAMVISSWDIGTIIGLIFYYYFQTATLFSVYILNNYHRENNVFIHIFS